MDTHTLTPQQFLDLLGKADVVVVDSGPYLSGWELHPLSGIPDNQVVRFSWTDGTEEVSYTLTEEGISEGTLTSTGEFYGNDSEGYAVEILFYKLVPLTPLQ